MAKKKQLSVNEVLRRLQARANQSLDAPTIDAVLAALDKTEATFSTAFVREAMRHAPAAPEARQAHWKETIVCLSKAGRQYSIGDEAFRDTLKRFTDSPWLLAACQAGTVASAAPVVVAAALAKDGSEVSHDALMVELERARSSRDRWALQYKLKSIRRYAAQNPAWRSFEAIVMGALEQRDAAAHQKSAAKTLGLKGLLRYSLYLQGFVRPQGPASLWLSVDDREGRLNAQALPIRIIEDFKSVLEMPAWLSGYTLKNAIRWDWETADVRSSLRGARRDAFTEWLRSGRSEPPTLK